MNYLIVVTFSGLFMSSAELSPSRRYRVSALECQRAGHFVLVSTFNNGQMLLSWGAPTSAGEIDIPVMLSQRSDDREYKGQNKDGKLVLLSAKIPIGDDLGVADFVVEDRDDFKEWNPMNCELFAED